MNYLKKYTSLEHETTYGYNQSSCKLDATHFAVAYAGTGDDGFVGTFEYIKDINLFSDSFNDNSLDTAKWNNWGTYDTGIAETLNRLQLTTKQTDGAYLGIKSDNTYNLTGAYAQVEVVNAGNQSLESYEAYPLVLSTSDEANQIYFAIIAGTLYAYKTVSGTPTSLATATYSATNHRFLRIRENAGTTYWETSADGEVWSILYSVANPITITALNVMINCGTWQTEASTTTLKIDNLKVLEYTHLIDSLEYDTSQGVAPCIFLIDSTHFGIAYRSGTLAGGRVKIFSFDGNFDNITEVDSFTHGTDATSYTSAILIKSGYFAVAYCKGGTSGNDGFITTFSYDGSYQITQVDDFEFDTSQAMDVSICLIDTTHIAVAYSDVDSDGIIKVLSIDANADNIATVTTLEHDTSNGTYNSVKLIDSTHLLLAYTYLTDNTKLKTFSIDGSYNLTEVDSINFVGGWYNSISELTTKKFALTYSDANSDGHLDYIEISDTYTISRTADNIFEKTKTAWASVTALSPTEIITAYQGDGDDGFLAPFEAKPYNGIVVKSETTLDGGYNPYYVVEMIDATHFIECVGKTWGYARVWNINDDFTITLVDSLLVTPSEISPEHLSLNKIDSKHFVLTYCNYNDVVKVVIIALDEDYDITIGTAIEVISSGDYCSSVLIDSTHLAVVYQNGSDDSGEIKIYSIDGSYNLTLVTTTTYDTYGYNASMTLIDSTHLAISYFGNTSRTRIRTFSIDGSYNLALIDDLDVWYSGDSNNLKLIDKNHLALNYAGGQGRLIIIGVDDSYNLSIIDNHVYSNSVVRSSISLIDSFNYIINDWLNSGSHPTSFRLLAVDGDWNVSSSYSLIHQTVTSLYPTISYPTIHKIDNNHFISIHFDYDNTDEKIKIIELANIQNSSLNLKTSGIDTGSLDVNLKTTGKTVDNSVLNLKTNGVLGFNSNLNLKTHGITNTYSETNLKTTGKTTDNSDINLKTSGCLETNSELNLKITGLESDSSEVNLKTTGIYRGETLLNLKVTGKDKFLVLTINATVRTDKLITNSLSINDVSNQTASSMICQVYDKDGTFTPLLNEEIIVENQDGRLFAGNIVKITPKALGSTVIYELICSDYTRILDRRLVVESYINQTDEFIIKDIINRYTGGTGITFNNVSGSTLINQITFNYKSPSQCLTDICKLTGASWYIDYNKDIHYFKLEDETSPLTISDNSTFEKDLTIVKDSSKIRNKIFIRGGTYLSDFTTITMVADGEQTVFNLPDKPHEITMTEGGVTKSIGIKNIDEPSDYDYLMNYQEKYVEKTGTAPTAGTVMAFQYKYNIPVLVGIQDNTSIEDVGVYEYAIFDSTITTIEQARSRGQAELTDYANELIEGSFSTLTDGWKAGQTIHIKKTHLGIDDNYLIKSVTIKSIGNGNFEYRIKLCSIETIGIVQYLINLLEADKLNSGVSGDETVDELFSPNSQTITATDSLIYDSLGAKPYKWGASKWGLSEWS